MPALKPFRSYNEGDVLNGFFRFSGTIPATAGTFVKVVSGFLADQGSTLLGDVGADYGNLVSDRWGVPAQVGACNASGDVPIGVLLHDVREVDENGEKLVFNPRKAIENGWTISGQAVSILPKGYVLYSGVAGTPTAGAPAFLGTNGDCNTSGSVANAAVTRVGTFLSPKDAAGWVLLKLDV